MLYSQPFRDEARRIAANVAKLRRRSMVLVVRQAGQRTHGNQYRGAIAAPIVGENSRGIRLAWRSFQTD